MGPARPVVAASARPPRAGRSEGTLACRAGAASRGHGALGRAVPTTWVPRALLARRTPAPRARCARRDRASSPRPVLVARRTPAPRVRPIRLRPRRAPVVCPRCSESSTGRDRWASPRVREPCQADNLWISTQATEAFPSSRPASDFPHRTGTQAPSQVTCLQGVRGADPSLVPMVEELHRDQQEPTLRAHPANEFHSAGVPSRPAAEILRRGQHVSRVRQTQRHPLRMASGDVENAFPGHPHSALPAEKPAWKGKVLRHPSCRERTRVAPFHATSLPRAGA